MTLFDFEYPKPHRLREPCRACGERERGQIKESGGQDVVRCASCGAWVYNAPRAETGRPQRSKRARPTLGPKRRMRILRRDEFMCQIPRCPNTDSPVEVGHIVSIAEGRRAGEGRIELPVLDRILNSDHNLQAQCEVCNSGLGERSLIGDTERFDPAAILLQLQAIAMAMGLEWGAKFEDDEADPSDS